MYEALASLAEEAIAEACWTHWSTLVGEATAPKKTRVIDPEALVLASLSVREHERRLTDRLAWCAARGSKLLSVQRMTSVAAHFPADVRESGLAWFAAQATRAGDARWKKLASGSPSDEPVRLGKGPALPNLLCPSTLMLSLRAGFGVGMKADLLSYLIGASASPHRTRVDPVASQIARVLSYSVPSVRRAAGDMALARFITGSTERSPRYSVDEQSWAQAIDLYDPRTSSPANEPAFEFDIPAWGFWTQSFAFLVAAREWGQAMSATSTDDVVAASRAHDIVEASGRALAWLGVELPQPSHYPGVRYLEAFQELVQRVAVTARE